VTKDKPAFEVEAATVEEFLRLLKEREDEVSVRGPRSAVRRTVFVAQVVDQRGSDYGLPMVRRYVTSSFAYGQDLVYYRRTTSNAVELPETAKKTQDRQQRIYEETRAEIEGGIEEVGLDVPVREGFLRRPADAGE
jgi:hypothetical protein